MESNKRRGMLDRHKESLAESMQTRRGMLGRNGASPAEFM